MMQELLISHLKNCRIILRTMLLEDIQTHRENAPLIVAVDMAYFSNKALFQDYLDLNKNEVNLIASALKLLQSAGYSYPNLDIETLSSTIFQMIDSVIHCHVNNMPVLPTDEQLAHFLAEVILRILRIPEKND